MIAKRQLKRMIFRMYNYGHSAEVIAEKLMLELEYVQKIIKFYLDNKK